MRGQHLGEFEELILLNVRILGREAHSVGIQDSLRAHAGREVSLGAIYAALDRLERKKHVHSWLAEPQRRPGGRARRCYRLTPQGLRTLDAMHQVRERLWALGGEPLEVSDS